MHFKFHITFWTTFARKLRSISHYRLFYTRYIDDDCSDSGLKAPNSNSLQWTHHWWCHTWSKIVSREEELHWIVIRFQRNIFGFLSIFMYLKDIKGDVQTVQWKYKQRSKCPRTDPLWIRRDRPVQATVQQNNEVILDSWLLTMSSQQLASMTHGYDTLYKWVAR